MAATSFLLGAIHYIGSFLHPRQLIDKQGHIRIRNSGTGPAQFSLWSANILAGCVESRRSFSEEAAIALG